MADLLSVYKAEFAPGLGLRADGFRVIVQLLQKQFRKKGPLTLIETGCVRDRRNKESDGHSTLLFHWFAQATRSRFITIDFSSAHCTLARKLCPGSTVLCGDSVQQLFRLSRQLPSIDFLYLDSFDLDWNNPHPSALHHLKELTAASPALKRGALVFVDDNAGAVGKGMYVREYLEGVGARCVHSGYQIGFVL